MASHDQSHPTYTADEALARTTQDPPMDAPFVGILNHLVDNATGEEHIQPHG